MPRRQHGPLVLRLTVTGVLSWQANANGTSRNMRIRKRFGPAWGANAGQHTGIQTFSSTPAPTGPTDQTMTIQVPLEAGDSVMLEGSTCGQNVPIDSASFSMERSGD